MKKIFALATVLCLAFALCLTSSAAIPEGWISTTGNAPENVYFVEGQGLMLNTACHSGIMLNTELTSNYTLEFEVRTASMPGISVPYVALGTSSDSWVNNASVVLAFRNWSDGYPHFIAHHGIGRMECISYYGNGKLYDEGYNKVVVMVDFEDGKQYLTYMINDELVAAGLEMPTSETTGNYIALCNYADRVLTEDEAMQNLGGFFKNFKVTVNGETTTYFEVAAPAPTPSTPDASTPDEPAGDVPSIEIKDDGEVAEFDWTIFAIIGGVVVVAAAAVVVFMVLKKKKDA